MFRRCINWQAFNRPIRACCAMLALALLLPAKPAHAERVVATVAAEAVVVERASLFSNEALNFGRVAAGNAAGTVGINPTTLTCTTTGPIARTGACQPAEFTGLGKRRLTMQIQIPTTVTLTRSGGTPTMSITSLVLGETPDLTLVLGGANPFYQVTTASGIFAFRVGGTLNVGANQQSGVYNGSFVVQVQYY